MKHNFIPSILIVAVEQWHYAIIQSSGCPTIIANGASQTGKSTATTAMNVALSIMDTVFTSRGYY